MLKQEQFYKKLQRNKLTPTSYAILYILYNKGLLTEKQVLYVQEKIPSKFLDGITISDEGRKFVESIDAMFSPIKKLKALDLLGDDFLNQISTYIETFPTQKLPSGKYARGDKKNIETNFMWFFQVYSYDWDTILRATSLYVNEYHAKNYLYMRTAAYFIKKQDNSQSIQSDLANYCDIILSKEDYLPERQHKTRVV